MAEVKRVQELHPLPSWPCAPMAKARSWEQRRVLLKPRALSRWDLAPWPGHLAIWGLCTSLVVDYSAGQQRGLPVHDLPWVVLPRGRI